MILGSRALKYKPFSRFFAMSKSQNRNSILTLAGAVLMAACAKELPPPSVDDLIDDPIRLEALVVRCAQNRAATRYDPECVNARQAVAVIEAGEERARREELARQSERKREALRRTQEAAAEARRRAADEERLRREAEYLGQFPELAPSGEAGAETSGVDELEGNVPGALMPEPAVDTAPVPVIGDPLLPTDGSNAPVAETPQPTDLDAVRDELRRRSDQGQ
jgi:flagellar biosynthesis GTPase FlhF